LPTGKETHRTNGSLFTNPPSQRSKDYECCFLPRHEKITFSNNILIAILQLMNKVIMGLAKTEMFTDQQNEITLVAKVFGHPARVAISQHLFKIDSCVCGDLVSEIGLAQPTISQHLKELKHVGLIKGNVEGTSVCYCIH